MTSYIRGTSNFDSDHMQLIQAWDDVNASGLGKGIGVTFDDAKYVRLDFALQAANDSHALRVRCGSGGSVDTGSTYSYATGNMNFNATPTYGDVGAASGSTYWELSSGVGNAGDESVAGRVEFYVIDDGTVERVFGHWFACVSNTSDVGYHLHGSGIYYGTQFPPNRFQIYHDGATDSWNSGWLRATGYK